MGSSFILDSVNQIKKHYCKINAAGFVPLTLLTEKDGITCQISLALTLGTIVVSIKCSSAVGRLAKAFLRVL